MRCHEAERLSNSQKHLLTPRVYRLLKDFSMAQQVLALELLRAKPLGISRITISGDPAMERGIVLVKSGTIHIVGSKENT